MSKNTTKLILITGFLGSGKTTFLYAGLETIEQSRIALICNEQGRFRIKSSGSFHRFNRSAMGSSLLKIIDRLLVYGYDYILVETSGFAQPMLLTQLAGKAEKRSRGKLRFRGMICVIDTLRFLKLFAAAVSLHEQAAYADCFVLSKTDLAEPENIQKIKNILKVIRPAAPVFICKKPHVPLKTIFAAIGRSR
ncbi:MAG: hypothetical protein LBD55_07855 [Treponema sp.]|jgi:G3E family GTPase|nr:hypothetical protein [Treponema sp.]